MASLLELVSQKGARDNLSRYGDEFVGRRLPLEQLTNTLGRKGAAVLIGPAGVGKSRLANEYGRRFLSSHPAASAWFCDLTTTEDTTEVLAAIGRPLGVRFTADISEETAAQRLGDVLSSLGTTLLIVDNAERHPDFVARCVETWRSETEHARFLITSRRPVGNLPDIRLRHLGQVEAVALLEDRVRRLRPDFPGGEAREGLRKLASELEGLPLALEIVAPRLRLLSPDQLLERLDLSSGPLEAALQRSWELLDEDERRAFAQTSVFRGGFDVPAAEEVVSIDGDVLAVLENLVDHSLAKIATTAEFPDETRLDYPVAVREFAAARLAESDERADTIDRHVDYFLEHGEAWDAGIDTGDEKESTRRLVVELPNLMAAWERTDGEARARLGLVLHLALQRGGTFNRQFEITEETLQLAREEDDDRLIGRAYLARARAQRWKNDFDASLEDLEAALEYARKADDVPTECSALRNLAAGHWGRGEPERTREYADEALRVSLESGNPVEEINSRNGLGFLLAHTGEPDGAQEHLEKALALSRELDAMPGLEALASSAMGALMTFRGQFEQAEFYTSRALELYRELDYVRSIPMELLGRAEARCAAGKLDAARDDVSKALQLTERMGFRTVALRGRHVATLVELLDDNIPAALDQIARAVSEIDESGDQVLLVGARLYEVIARALLDALTQAERAWEAVEELTEGREGGPWSNQALVAEGFLELARSRHAEAPAQHLAVARKRAQTAFDDDAVASSLARLLATKLPDGAPRFRITGDGRAFSPPAGEPVDITRRKALRGILKLLAELRRDTPGEPATLDDVLEAGWPDEVMTHESGKRRVYVSVKRLRDLGLEGLLVTAGDGYMLDPKVPVEFVDSI